MVTAKFKFPTTIHEIMMVSMVPTARHEMVFTTLRRFRSTVFPFILFSTVEFILKESYFLLLIR